MTIRHEHDPYWPKFLRVPDPETPHTHEQWLRRAQLAYPGIVSGREDRALRLNFGYGERPWDVEDALQYGEAIARRELA